MRFPDSFHVTTRGDTEIVVTRSFAAPRRLVFDAHTQPELVRRWLLGTPGWTMPVCEIDLKVGGKYRYVWQHEADGRRMGMGGEFREIVVNEKLVATECFDEAWYAGEALDITELVEQSDANGLVTHLTLTVRYQSKEARDMAASSGMETGMKAGYENLESVLESL